MKRVVVTGIGPITSIGHGREAFGNALERGVSGIGPITRFDHTNFATHVAGEIKDFDPQTFGLDRRQIKRLDLFAQYALAAANLAMQDANLTIKDPYDCIVRMGVGIGGIETIAEQMAILAEKGPRSVGAITVPTLMPNAAAANISIVHGIKGEAVTVNSACASGLTAIGDAYEKILLGRCSVAITGGAEAISIPFSYASFGQARTLSAAGISRPFDKNRDGFVMGEGAGVLVLEELGHAMRRDANIYAEIVGYDATSDAHNLTAPDPEVRGLTRAIHVAIRNAKIYPQDISYVNAHGTSTELNDKLETLAITYGLGHWSKSTPVSSTKSMIGHLIGGAAAVETIATIIGMQNHFLPPTINYETPDPECTLDYVPNVARPANIRYALKTSLGFGGHNAALVLRRFEH